MSYFVSIVYNRANVYIQQNFLKVVVHVVIIVQWNQTAHLYEIQVTVIYSRTILVTDVTLQRGLCVKPGLALRQTVKTCTVCLN